MKKIFLISLWAAVTMVPVLAFAKSGYHLLKKIPIPGNGSWDYVSVDAVNRRVYVSHGNQIEVLDADSDALVGRIPAPRTEPSNKSRSQGIHGAALAPQLGRGFTSNGRAGSMTIFDLKTLKILGETKVGAGPDGILYDPFTRRAFTFSHHTKAATAVDGLTGKVVGSIALGGEPEAAKSDGRGHAFVNIEDKNQVLKLDVRNLKVLARWKTDPCHEPASMAIDPSTDRIFVGCRNKLLAVFNTGNGHILTTLPIGAGTDSAAYDPETHLIFTSNGEGTITVIQQHSANNYSVLDTVKTEPGARTMGLDSKTHRLFLSLADRAKQPQAKRGERRRRPPILPGTFRVLIVGRK